MSVPSPKHFKASPPKLSKEQLSLSTARLYQESQPANAHDLNAPENHLGLFKHQRCGLDYTYHLLPSSARQQLQDSLLSDYLDNPETSCRTCKSDKSDKPLALFTAGGMGAGKSHVLRYLVDEGHIQLPHDFIWIDPDRIARRLPERPQYLEHNPDAASALMLPEAGFLQEILQQFAMNGQRSMVIDGSFTDAKWNEFLMKTVRDAGYSLQLLFVFASEEAMINRANNRAKATGRVTKPDSIRSSRMKSPLVVRKLGRKDVVDRVRLVDNSSDDRNPKIVFDSEHDEKWQEGQQVDVDVYLSMADGHSKP